MSFVIALPDVLVTAASDLSGIGSAIRSARAAAAGSTTQVAAAAGDEVSAAIARLFGTYGQEFQTLSAQSALFNSQFVQLLQAAVHDAPWRAVPASRPTAAPHSPARADLPG